MVDFETHPVGTAKELELLRKMYNVVDQLSNQYGPRIFPSAVRQLYDEIKTWQDNKE